MASSAMIGQIRNGFWVCCRYSGKISQQQKGQRLYIVDIETTVAGQDPRYTSDLHSSLIEWASSRSPQSHSPKLKERKKRQKVGDGKKKRKEKKRKLALQFRISMLMTDLVQPPYPVFFMCRLQGRKTWPPPGLSSAYPDSRAEYNYRFPHSFRRNRKEHLNPISGYV